VGMAQKCQKEVEEPGTASQHHKKSTSGLLLHAREVEEAQGLTLGPTPWRPMAGTRI